MPLLIDICNVPTDFVENELLNKNLYNDLSETNSFLTI